jgi:hypothetical protein
MANHEFLVENILLKKNFEIFMPRISISSRRKDRKKIIDVPLFEVIALSIQIFGQKIIMK